MRDKIESAEKYSNSKMGFEVDYPASWIVKEAGDTVEINPPGVRSTVYFSVGLRSEFRSLDEVKKKLGANIAIIPIQIGNASGFKYKDGGDYEAIWLIHSNNVYIIRVYFIKEDANRILSTLKFDM